MAIDLSGDVIYFDGRPVGFITVPNGSLRAGFEELLGYDVSGEVASVEAQLRAEEDDHAETNGKLQDALRWVKKNYSNDEVLIEILS